MGLGPTLAFWAILFCIALWQSPDMLDIVTEAEPVAVVAPVDKAPVRIAAPRPVPHSKFDLSEYTQNTEFFLGSPQGNTETTIGNSERSGRFDSEGRLIFPRDPKNMH